MIYIFRCRNELCTNKIVFSDKDLTNPKCEVCGHTLYRDTQNIAAYPVIETKESSTIQPLKNPILKSIRKKLDKALDLILEAHNELELIDNKDETSKRRKRSAASRSLPGG